jgi:hypothetical protein
MSRSKPTGGLRPLSDLRATSLEMPAARSRKLTLEHAWRKTAGAALARRTSGIRVVRGVLEVTVTDPRWEREIRSLLPGLAATVAGDHPELGVRKCRLRLEGEPGRSAAEPLPPAPVRNPGAGEAGHPRPGRADSRSPAGDAVSLERLVQRYLARAASRDRGPR